MYWQDRFKQEDPDKEAMDLIASIREEHKDYGYRRMTKELMRRGALMNKKKVQRLMQKMGLQVTSFGRKSRSYSTYKGKIGTIAPNRINRRFETCIAYQKITTDTTEFKYYEKDSSGNLQQKKAYLDPYMDLYNREILCYRFGKQPTGETVMEGLEEVIRITSDCPFRRIFHSDQGWAYQMKSYTHRLRKEKIYQSLSRRGNCWESLPPWVQCSHGKLFWNTEARDLSWLRV